MKQNTKWTAEEMEQLRHYFVDDGLPISKISCLLGRTHDSVYSKLVSMGLHQRPKNPSLYHKAPISLEDNGCGYSSSCQRCTLPACIDDGYHPRSSPASYKVRKWTEKEMLEVYKKSEWLSVEALANIWLTPEDEIRRVIDHVKRSLNEKQRSDLC